LEGQLPVRVLMHYIPGWLEEHWPDLNEEMGAEVKFNGLNPGIAFHVEAKPIDSVACIDDSRKIHLWENYLQLLWCTCYAQQALYEAWQRSVRAGRPAGRYDSTDPAVRTAFDVLDAGVGLLDLFDPRQFEGLPMPLNPDGEQDELVAKANILFVAATGFIILHEYAHHLFEHVAIISGEEESKKHEVAADDFALSFLRRGEGRGRDVDNINALGVLATMTTLMLMEPSLEGGPAHPDIHERLLNALERLNLSGAGEIWVSGCICLQTWGRYYPVPVVVRDPAIARDPQDMFRDILGQIVRHQHPKYRL